MLRNNKKISLCPHVGWSSFHVLHSFLCYMCALLSVHFNLYHHHLMLLSNQHHLQTVLWFYFHLVYICISLISNVIIVFIVVVPISKMHYESFS